MTTFSELIANVASDLRQAGFIEEANDLQLFADFAFNQTLLGKTRKDALEQIEIRCHVKWLGDLYLPYLSQKDWWGEA